MAMREWDESTVTEEVVRRFEAAPPRLRQVMTALTRHLHAFAREVTLTEAEWMAAIEFLTRTGQACSDTRQEFILLSDTLGLSTLVDALNHRAAPGATRSTVLGPFFVQAAPAAENGARIDAGRDAQPLLVEAAIQDTAGRPIAGATVDVWHADSEGFYDVQRDGGGLSHRARFTSDAEGRIRFWTDMPVSYPVPDDGPVGDMLKATARHPWRPAHVHFMIAAPGHERLVTHIFVAGDPYLDSDVVFAVKDALIGDFAAMPAGVARDGRAMDRPYRLLDYTFGLQPAAR
ncbi:MAG TPA: intradiol ring-cleavage dioxygenase [Roseomonas sp.]|jgi:hydroxyquinol 1,2-dioxygenase